MSAAIRITRDDCADCGGTHRVWSEALGLEIRCTSCTRRAKPRDPKAMELVNADLIKHERQQLSGAEARRVSRTITQIVADAFLDAFSFKGLPTHLVTTDRIIQRYYAAPTGVPSENPDLYLEARPPPLDPKTQEAVGDVLKASSMGIREFIWDWYDTTGLSMNDMAKRRKMSRRQLDREHQDVLVSLRGKFLASPHNDLVRMTRVLP